MPYLPVRIITLLATLCLASCGPLISFGAGAPDEVYTLRYPVSGTPAQEGPVLHVEQPFMTGGLGGTSIKATLNGAERTKISGVGWDNEISELIRDYLVLSLSDGTGVRALGQGLLDVNSSCRLVTRVWRFEMVPGASVSDDIVDINLELSLIRVQDGALLGRDRFPAKASVGGKSARSVASAFERAMAEITPLQQEWLRRYAPDCEMREAG